MLHILIDSLRNSILITGLVIVMMMMIESMNIESRGLIFRGLKKTKIGQVVLGALLGSIPGCMGGFATVSLYSHGIFSFGALVAMMIASSGDEAFIMLAMIPDKALIIFTILFVVAVVAGISTDLIRDKVHKRHCFKEEHSSCDRNSDCDHGFKVCDDSEIKKNSSDHPANKHFGWKRLVMLIGLTVFIVALVSGWLGHNHDAHIHAEHPHEIHADVTLTHDSHSDESLAHDSHTHDVKSQETDSHAHFDLLSEDWMNILFAGLSVIILFVLILASDHFIEKHLWDHIIKKHLPAIFCWTFGVLLIVGIGLEHLHLESWISQNVALMIVLAALIGIIPESGPHMIFVTLYATGIIPLPVLLASSISQDGHASLPLLAENRKRFLLAKAINVTVAILIGFIAHAII